MKIDSNWLVSFFLATLIEWEKAFDKGKKKRCLLLEGQGQATIKIYAALYNISIKQAEKFLFKEAQKRVEETYDDEIKRIEKED